MRFGFLLKRGKPEARDIAAELGGVLRARGCRLVALEDVPDSAPGADEILIRPVATGLCGTDLEIIDGRIDPAAFEVMKAGIFDDAWKFSEK